MNATASRAVDLSCPECSSRASMHELQTLCACGRPWLVDYDLSDLDGAKWVKSLAARAWSLWRYRELLPVQDVERRIGLGEGATPLLAQPPLQFAGGQAQLWIKQEAGNPTGSFKDRGLAIAVNRARELGVDGVELPSAGNAGISAAAYAAAAGMRCRVAVPQPTPSRVIEHCRDYGAEVLVSGETLVDAGAALKSDPIGLLSLATLREPYRVEGKKSLAFELAEQMRWRLPDWIVFPTGGGTGIVAMHKAFSELRKIGVIDSQPRLVAVQSDACAPLVEAFGSCKEEADRWPAPSTRAWGLKVPQAVGDRLTLRALRESGGCAVSVEEMQIAQRAWQAQKERGLVVGPEGAAALLAADRLVESGRIEDGQSVVVFQTGHPGNYA